MAFQLKSSGMRKIVYEKLKISRNEIAWQVHSTGPTAVPMLFIPQSIYSRCKSECRQPTENN